jgi:hypothetical protein
MSTDELLKVTAILTKLARDTEKERSHLKKVSLTSLTYFTLLFSVFPFVFLFYSFARYIFPFDSHSLFSDLMLHTSHTTVHYSYHPSYPSPYQVLRARERLIEDLREELTSLRDETLTLRSTLVDIQQSQTSPGSPEPEAMVVDPLPRRPHQNSFGRGSLNSESYFYDFRLTIILIAFEYQSQVNYSPYTFNSPWISKFTFKFYFNFT